MHLLFTIQYNIDLSRQIMTLNFKNQMLKMGMLFDRQSTIRDKMREEPMVANKKRKIKVEEDSEKFEPIIEIPEDHPNFKKIKIEDTSDVESVISLSVPTEKFEDMSLGESQTDDSSLITMFSNIDLWYSSEYKNRLLL